MAHFEYLNFAIILSLFLCLHGKDIEEGQPCKLRDKTKGICAPYTTCKHLIEGEAKICTYTPKEAIVCCPKKTDDRISVQKCKEYKALAIEKKTYSTGSSSFTQERNVCQFNAEFIVGGTKANIAEFPHMAAIGYQTDNGIGFFCGGSLISEIFVLTAAHCKFYQNNGKPSIVRLGAKTLDNATTNDYKIIEHIGHPNYSHHSKYNDIALFKLEKSVIFFDKIRPACLESSHDIANNNVIATGYGLTEDDELSNNLLKVTLQILDNKICEKTFKHRRKIPKGLDEGQMCVGDLKESKDTCAGDSGGPLQTLDQENKCIHKIIGITSFGSSHCGLLGGAVYTKVLFYLDWIESIVWM